jgi:hypothetical protein
MQNLLSSHLLLKNVKILPVALYGCETWSLILKEEHRLRVFEIRVLRRDEMMGVWRKLQNEELGDLYSFCQV